MAPKAAVLNYDIIMLIIQKEVFSMKQDRAEMEKNMEIPNAETQAAMAEADEILLSRRKRLGILQG